jgi:hypothetical protein
MKRQILTLVMMMAAIAASAQVVLWDGEDKEVNTDGGFWNRASPTVVDDNGNKCLKVTLQANPEGWDKEHCNAALPLGDIDFKSLRRMTMRIKMSINHNVLVKVVKDGDGGYSTGRLFWCGNADQWNILTFEFAAGPDSEKITDTGNTVLEIWPFEEGGDALNNVGQTIYIDDIKMEGPMVDGKGLLAFADNSLTNEVVVTGVIGKGNYQCTWNGDWHPEAYDDYALLAAKLASTTTKLDVSGAGRWDEDWDVIKAKCPGVEIITETSTGIQQTNMYQDATNETYTLTGMRVATPTEKGIYIVGGRKVLVK